MPFLHFWIKLTVRRKIKGRAHPHSTQKDSPFFLSSSKPFALKPFLIWSYHFKTRFYTDALQVVFLDVTPCRLVNSYRRCKRSHPLRRIKFSESFSAYISASDICLQAAPWIRPSFIGLWIRRPLHVGFVVDKVPPGQTYFRLLRVSPLSITLTIHHTHLHLSLTSYRPTHNNRERR